MSYVCSKCGGGSVEPVASRPSLDDRYAVGHCARCTPRPKLVNGKMRPAVRSTVALVRADLYDDDRARAAARHRRERTVVRRAAGLTKGRPSDADLAESRRIHARWDAEAEERRA